MNPELGERAGVGHYTYYLVKNLLRIDKTNEYVLFFDWRVRDTREFDQKNVRIRHFPFSQYKKFLPFAYSHMLTSAYLLKERLDVYHSPANVIPLAYPKKAVITIHDLAIYKNPGWFPGQIFSTRLLVPQSVKKANRIIAVSKSTKRDLQDLFSVPSKKVVVIYEGVQVEKIPVHSRAIDKVSQRNIGSKYILFVGTLEPRKNLLTLLRAYKKLLTWDKKFEAYKLILAGHKGWKHEEIFDAIRELGLKKHVQYVGYITHNDKIELIKRASCFVNPSFYEGFGLTMVEAMALGTPLIASNVSSIPEVVGDAGTLVDPEKDDELAAALKKMLSSSSVREAFVQKGRAQAKKFSWDRCARETKKVYESLKK